MDHEDAVKVLKDAQGIIAVVNHTTLVTCVHFIVGTLKMVVKYSPRGTVVMKLHVHNVMTYHIRIFL